MLTNKNLGSIFVYSLVVGLSLFFLIAPASELEAKEELVLATTTSTYDSGLLGKLNPVFEQRFDVKIKTIAVGTGAAIRHAKNGDADVIMVHARPAEDEFLQEGWGVNRRDLMYNDFVIVGPERDPAGLSGMKKASAAFRKLAGSGSKFVSRGDDSGTHKKELSIWDAAGIDPGGKWYLQIGKGMGDTLVQADRMGAYTLSDRGTYLSMKDRLDLEILVQGPVKGGDPVLRNPYGVIAVNPAKYPSVNYSMAMAYIGFVTSPRGQEIIGSYEVKGEQLFFPSALSKEPNFAQYVPRDFRK
ncbi:MAG: substrate-binding domain-containing protein [Candidatus Bipolaricaulia bacterium]